MFNANSMTSLWLETLVLEESEAMVEKHSSGYKVLLQALLMMVWDWEELALLLEFFCELTPATMPTTVATRNKVAKRAKKSFFLLFLLDKEIWLTSESEILEKGCLILLMVYMGGLILVKREEDRSEAYVLEKGII